MFEIHVQNTIYHNCFNELKQILALQQMEFAILVLHSTATIWVQSNMTLKILI